MRVVVLTRLFPNALEPLWSPFNRQQFAALGRLCDVDVLGVIPWFPGARALRRVSAAGRLVDVPARETIDGLTIHHPRYLLLPKLPAASAALYAASLLPAAWRRRGADVLLGAWAYPDGAATVMLGELLGLPTVIKVHGSDLNVVGKLPSVRAHLRALLPRATRLVAVSRPLADELAALGSPRERIAVVPNGVDATLFHPRDRAAARAALGLPRDGRLVVYVGRLVREKGLVELLNAFAQLAPRHPDLSLALVGDGAARAELQSLAERIGTRVLLAGARPIDEIPSWLAACDLFTLPSWNEGTPNVLLEALACGRRAVTSDVGGIPDVMTSPSLGEMVKPMDADALAAAIARQAYADYSPDDVAALGARGGWAESAARLHRVLAEAAAQPRGGGR
jgi:teichuronic acid biosynthesis glycosyltransferase TuaC